MARTKIAIKGQISEYIPNPTFEVVAPPGAQEEYYRHGNPDGKSLREIFGKPIRCPEWARNAQARLPHLDELGIEGSLMFPTLASLLEERMRDDPDLTHVVVHSLNQWIHDEWTFNYHDRIFATPIITLPIVDEAIKELEWCLERGAPLHPDPTGAGVGSAGAAVAGPARVRSVLGQGPGGRRAGGHALVGLGLRRPGVDLGGPHGVPAVQAQPAAACWSLQNRAISDMMTAMVCHGAFTRFPNLRIATIENGGTWVAPLVEKFEGIYKKMPQEFAEHPVEAFRRNVYVNPFWEDALDGLIEIMSPDRLLFGSDYPHPEGLGNPISFYDDLPSSLSQADAGQDHGRQPERAAGGLTAGVEHRDRSGRRYAGSIGGGQGRRGRDLDVRTLRGIGAGGLGRGGHQGREPCGRRPAAGVDHVGADPRRGRELHGGAAQPGQAVGGPQSRPPRRP